MSSEIKEEMLQTRRLPLQGIRIADFTWWGVGPYVTRMLANHGAEVIRIESISRVDPIRGTIPFTQGKIGLNVSGYFNNFNPSKLGMTLNVSHPKGVEIAKRLIAISDVVADNFTPHVMENWGLGYEELVKIKPDIIVLSMPLMGRVGPYKDFGAYGHQIESLAGLSSLTGFPDRPPVGSGIAWPDFTCNPYHATTALLAALHYRNRTGKGQFIELTQFESSVCVLETAILDYTVNKRVQTRHGNHLPNAAPHAVYRCQGDDRWCAIAVFSDEEWKAFCNVLGKPPWTKDERFFTLLARKKNEEELDRLVEAWTIERTAEEVMILMQGVGVAAGVVQTGEDLLTHDSHLRARGFYWVLDHPEAGRTTYDGVPFKLSATPAQLRRAHLLGEHTDFVCKDILGMPEEEINQLIVDGVLQ